MRTGIAAVVVGHGVYLLAQRTTAATLRSTSSSVVFQQLTLTRIAARPRQVVG